MTAPWLTELNDGWEAARGAFRAEGDVIAAAMIAEYLGLSLSEPLDARIATHALRVLLLTQGFIRPGQRSRTFSWLGEGETGAKCWLFPLFDGAAELVEVLAFDVEGRDECDIFSYGESTDHVGLDMSGWHGDKRLVLFARPRAWLRFWIRRFRAREAERLRFYEMSPESCGALIVRPEAMNFSPVQRTRASWANGVDEVLVMDRELGERVAAAFRAAATNVLPELKVAGAQGG